MFGAGGKLLCLSPEPPENNIDLPLPIGGGGVMLLTNRASSASIFSKSLLALHCNCCQCIASNDNLLKQPSHERSGIPPPVGDTGELGVGDPDDCDCVRPRPAEQVAQHNTPQDLQ